MMKTETLPENVLQDPEDESANLIASLTPEDVERLWSVLIQLKPHLQE